LFELIEIAEALALPGKINGFATLLSKPASNAAVALVEVSRQREQGAPAQDSAKVLTPLSVVGIANIRVMSFFVTIDGGQNQPCGVVQCGHLVVTQFYELQRRQFLPPAPCVIIEYYHWLEPGGDVSGLALKTAWYELRGSLGYGKGSQ
jgi:hypothetical protein